MSRAVDLAVEPLKKISDGFVKIGKDVEQNFRRFGDNFRDNVENMMNEKVNNRKSSKIWLANSHEQLSIFRIRSLRKLLDVVERKYSFVSIVLLLINTAMEATAVGIFLKVQNSDIVKHHLEFDWGLGNFITLGILSIFFTISWVCLLIVENKKFQFLFQPASIMFYFSAGWMLVLSVMAMVNPKYTRAYVPMFLRLWWLHECILVLLDYPQISAFFKEDKLELMRALVQCFAVIGICVGLFQAMEAYYGTNPLDYFSTTYFMMVVFSSIGYGDIEISTALSRLLLIVLMIVGAVYFVPFLEYIANVGVNHLNFKTYTRWFKWTDHIIFMGNLDENNLRLQLENIFAGTRCYLQMHVVVVLPDQPEAGILLLLNAPKYRSSVTLLVGDPSNEADLDRCNARGASAIFLFGEGVNSSYYSDYETAKQATTISNYLPKIPLYVFLHRSRYTRSMIPPGVCILEIERMNQTLLGWGAVLPGMLPLVGNLIRQFDPMTQFQVWSPSDFDNAKTSAVAVARAVRNIGTKQREMFSYGTIFDGGGETSEDGVAILPAEDVDWKHVYEASMSQQIIVVPMPDNQRGRSIRSMCYFLYKQGITFIGVVRRNEESPVPSVVVSSSGRLHDVEKIIVISDKEKTVKEALETLPPVRAENPSDTLGFDDPRSFGALRQLVQSEGGLAGGSFAFSPVSVNQSFVNHSFVNQSFARPVTMGSNRNSSFDSIIIAEPAGNHDHDHKLTYKPAEGVTVEADSEEEAGKEMRKVTSREETASNPIPSSRPASTDTFSEKMMKLASDPEFMKKVASMKNLAAEGTPHAEDVVGKEPTPASPLARSMIQHVENANHLFGHVVFVELSSGFERTSWSMEAGVESATAKATDVFDAIRPVRRHSPLTNVVLLANEENYSFLQMLWEQETYGCLSIVQGCGLIHEDLEKCNFTQAAAVVVFCAGERSDPQGDILSVLTAKNIRELCQSEIPIVVELDETWHTHLLSRNSFPGSSLNWITEPSFMSGAVVCRHMLDTCLQESFFVPEFMSILEQILAGRKDSLMVTSLACQEGWKRYEDVVDYCLDRRLLPLGIHRLHMEDRGVGMTKAVFRFMVTNPPSAFPLRIEDVIYCLKVQISK